MYAQLYASAAMQCYRAQCKQVGQMINLTYPWEASLICLLCCTAAIQEAGFMGPVNNKMSYILSVSIFNNASKQYIMILYKTICMCLDPQEDSTNKKREFMKTGAKSIVDYQAPYVCRRA